MEAEMIKNLELQLAEIGKIKIGEKGKKIVRNGKEWYQPVKLPYFKVTTVERDSSGNFITDKQVMSQYPEKTQVLDVMLLHDEIEKNFQSAYIFYPGKTCKCRGDGETATRFYEDGTSKVIKCEPSKCEYFTGVKEDGTKLKGSRCKYNGLLTCLLLKSIRLGGVYKFRTTSFFSVRNITTALKFISEITGGRLRGIPFKLTMGGKNSSVPGRGLFYTVNLEFHGTPIELLEHTMSVAKTRALLKREVKALDFKEIAIESAMSEDELIEFYPENQENYPHPAKAITKVNPKEVEVVDTQTGEVKQETPVAEVPEPPTPEEIARAEKKARIVQLKKELIDIFDEHNVSGSDRKDVCTEVLGVYNVSASRSEEKLIALKAYLNETYANAEKDESEEL
jgi:hypothetical protein